MSEHILERISAFLDGTLPEGARTQVEAHLAQCDLCRTEMEELHVLRTRLGAMPRREAPPSLMRSLGHAFLDAPVPRRSFWAFLTGVPSWRPVGAFAAVAVIMGGVAYLRLGPPAKMDPQPLIAAHMRYQAESLVPNTDPAHSNLSAQLVNYYREND
jgi:anti-sigma factor RsiW